MESNIIPRIPGYTNEMMLEKCTLLLKVVQMTKEVKVVRGKKEEIRNVPKHPTNDETVKSIKDSIEHYKNAKDDVEPIKLNSFQFRDYQNEIIKQGCSIIKEHGFLYLAMEVRTGKTLTSLGICKYLFAENVLFITKKKAISSIKKDYQTLDPIFNLEVINYESLHTVCYKHKWDVVICDEAHSMGAFPKPSNRAEDVGALIDMYKPFVILLSGTPTPESYSQMYHQVYKIPKNPFSQYKNFYRFCDDYVKVKQRKINGLCINDYSNGLDKILEAMKPYTITYTQVQAGFISEIEEEVLTVSLKERTINIIEKLKKDLIVQGKEEVILADTAVKLMMKLHQLFSGTIKFESGNSMIVDSSKAEFIAEHFNGCKIGIFYVFKEELEALKNVYGDMLTTELDEFDNDPHKSIALQIVSGREGVSLRNAEYLVYYNIAFSATSYWQSRDRMTTMDRKFNKIYWVFSHNGIEWDIYKAVTDKRDYTLNHFKKDLSL